MKRYILLTFVLGAMFSMAWGQEKLNDEEIEVVKKIMHDNPKCRSHVIWFESNDALEHYISTIPGRCPDDVERVLNEAEDWHRDNNMILRLEKQIYPKPGSKKSEKSLASHFNDVEKAKETFRCSHGAESMYEKLTQATDGFVDASRNRVYQAPKGELTYYHYRSGGGMIRRPPVDATLTRGKDGTYVAHMSTDEFNQYDTIQVTLEQVDTIRKMLIDGEVYKMPRYYDEPYMIFDAPHSSCAVKFSDASFSCNKYPPQDWGGKNIYAVYQFLRKLQPKHERKEE